MPDSGFTFVSRHTGSALGASRCSIGPDSRWTIGGQNPGETGRNLGQNPVRRGPAASPDLQGEVRPNGSIRVCLPCRRSRVRVPSAASEKSPGLGRFCAFQPAPCTELGRLLLARVPSGCQTLRLARRARVGTAAWRPLRQAGQRQPQRDARSSPSRTPPPIATRTRNRRTARRRPPTRRGRAQ
jgi:hypothetical protein